jgi:hypothetical protein
LKFETIQERENKTNLTFILICRRAHDYFLHEYALNTNIIIIILFTKSVRCKYILSAWALANTLYVLYKIIISVYVYNAFCLLLACIKYIFFVIIWNINYFCFNHIEFEATLFIKICFFLFSLSFFFYFL